MIGGGSNSFWFSSNVSNILGDGHSIKFLIENWLLGMEPLKEVFPLFFAKMTENDIVIAKMFPLD
jgi:hypothetical protein